MRAAWRVIALAFAFLSAIGDPAAAQQNDRAARSRALHDQAKQAYQRGEFHRAARLFREAYDLSPDPALLFNLAQAHRFAGGCAEAARSYRRFLVERPDAPNRAHVEEKISEMDACSERSVATQPAVPAATAPQIPAAAVAATPPVDRDRRRSSAGLWIAGGGGLVLGASAVFWYRAWDADRRIDDRIASGGTWDSSWEALESRRGRDQTIAQVATGLGMAALAGGLVYHLTVERQRANLSARVEAGGGVSIVYARDL